MSYKPIPTLDSNNATFVGNINACTNILSGGTDIADIFALASTAGDITAVTAGTGLKSEEEQVVAVTICHCDTSSTRLC